MSKQHLAIEVYKVFSIQSLFGEKLQIRSQHTNYVSYYDDGISCDVTLLVSKMCKEQLY